MRKGFVYKRVPHITLKSIANNEEIDAIHARWQERLEPLRVKLSAAVTGSAGVPPAAPPKGAKRASSGSSGAAAGGTPALPGWEEWEIPREADEGWTAEAIRLHAQWWKLRQERQQEIDASIARRADTELLFDQPYEDNKRVRVAGPFTVEVGH